MSPSLEIPRLAFVGSIHGNEPLGQAVHRDIQTNLQLPGLVSVEGHPDALAANKRYLGDEGELGGLLPGDIHSPNPDRRQAAELHRWLKEMNPWLAIDSHNNDGSTPESEFLVVGSPTTPAALAVGHVLGLPNVIVAPTYAMYRCYPELVATEQIVHRNTDIQKLVTAWRSHLTDIHARGPEGMAELFESGPELQYYIRVGFLDLIKNGKPNDFILDIIEELEVATDTIERFAPLHLSDKIKVYLGVAGLELAVSSWDSCNMSKPAPQLGRSVRSGKLRREVFGGCLARWDPPKPAAQPGHVVFEAKTFNVDHW
ncbi:MAG TPA: hypothetical protein VJ836_04125 [Candidatus Saccharimonadales bacterium]|nr:hypothetical protein [Candidatus Saccharimonadales bacterium]